jgi:hypothetical protein
MNQSELLHYKNLLLEKQQEVSASKSLGGSIPAGGERGGDPVDMAASEISALRPGALKAGRQQALAGH